MRAAPAVSCAKLCEKSCTRAYRAAENIRHSLRKEVNGRGKFSQINAMGMLCSILCHKSLPSGCGKKYCSM